MLGNVCAYFKILFVLKYEQLNTKLLTVPVSWSYGVYFSSV